MKNSVSDISLFAILFVFTVLYLPGCIEPESKVLEPEKLSVFKKVAMVGSVEITLADLELDYTTANGKRPAEDLTPEIALDNTLRVIQNRIIFFLEGVEAGLDRDPDLVEGLDTTFKYWIAQRFAEEWDPNDPIVVSQDEMAVLEPPTYEKLLLRIVTLPSESEAANVRSALSNSDDFASLAPIISVDPQAQKGGRINLPVWRGQESFFTNEIIEKLFKYSESDVTEPIETSFGWSIFLIEKREPLKDSEREQRRRLFHGILYSEKYAKELRKVLVKHGLEYNPLDLREERFSKYSPDRIVATVGDQDVNAREVIKHARNTGTLKRDGTANWEEALEGLASVLALYAEAKERGLTETRQARSAFEWTRRKRVSDKYILSLKENREVSDDELWDYYRKEVATNFGKDGAGWFDLKEIQTSNMEAARKAGDELRDGHSWDQVFTRYNIGQELEPEGDLGRRLILTMPWEVFSLLSSVEVGWPTDPYRRQNGNFSVILPVGKDGTRVKSFDEVRDSVVENYSMELQKKTKIHVLQKGMKKYPLIITEREHALNKMEDMLNDARLKYSGGGQGSGHGAPAPGQRLSH